MTSFIFFNAHPKGLKVGDCVKRAITKATGMDYMEVQRELNRYKKVTGADAFNCKTNYKPYIEKVLKGKKISFPAKKGFNRMDGYHFANRYPKGKFILSMAGHLTACIDGVIYDTWDCREKCVYTAWEIK